MLKTNPLFMLIVLTVNIPGIHGEDPVQFVSPWIGTGAHGHTYPGAAVPFGMVQLSPDTDIQGWDWCSGYHQSDSSLLGFSHTHLSGTGASDLGDFLFIPTVGKIRWDRGTKTEPGSGYRSRFSHGSEKAVPGYYSVFLDDYRVLAELTVSERVGFQRYTYPQSDSAHVLVDLDHQIRKDGNAVVWAMVRVEGPNRITGWRQTHGWADTRFSYFAAEFSKPFRSYLIAVDGKPQPGMPAASGKNVKIVLNYSTDQDEPILVKTGISFVSTDGALRNLNAEVPHWDFDSVRQQAEQKWNRELSRIEIQADRRTKTIFYTALYHSMLAPLLHMDADSMYRGLDQNIHRAEGFTNYTVFSLWDTFRALHPLFTLVQQKRVPDLIQSMLAHYDQSAFRMLPIWSLAHNETWCMIGYHSVPVIVDAWNKKIGGFDAERAYDAIRSTATREEYAGLGHYMKLGYVPIDLEKEAASKTLEYAYDDWCIARMAKALGKKQDAEIFARRAESYKNIFDAKTGFMRAKRSDGTWREPFDPCFAKPGSDFTEGNSWQYSWFVPHDVRGLIALMGGKKRFIEKLDAAFTFEAPKNEGAPVDMTGMIGQYAHGNEPSHHIAYLYAYAGAPWKTQERVRKIMQTQYNETHEGLSGNEDCGQMSAWYLFSAMGFYPVNPANGIYVFGSPLLGKCILHLDKGKTFTILAENAGSNHPYIQSVLLNGVPYSNTWIRHADIEKGGTIVFEMGPKPNPRWGTSADAVPPEHD